MQTKLSAAQITELTQRPDGASPRSPRHRRQDRRALPALARPAHRRGSRRRERRRRSCKPPTSRPRGGGWWPRLRCDAAARGCGIADRRPMASPAPRSRPEAAAAPERAARRLAPLEAAAQAGELPAPPDFSAPTHARFRTRLGQIVALAEAGDIAGLRAVVINPVSSSPKALARYRDLCITALEARKGASA